MQTILQSMQDKHTAAPSGVFIEDDKHQVYRYSDLLQYAAVLSLQFQEVGVGRLDRVAILMPDGPLLALAFLCTSCHGIAAPINPSASIIECMGWMDDLKPSAMVTGPVPSPTALEVSSRLQIPLVVFDPDHLTSASTPSFHFQQPREEDVALILHTSGTTAKPKMVPLTHRNLLSSAQNIAATLRLNPDDTCLNQMPLFHIHGIVACLLAPLVSGSKVVMPHVMEAAVFFRLLNNRNATWFSAVPTRHRHLLDHIHHHPEALKSHTLRMIRSSSSALPSSLLLELEQAFGVPVIEAYGMTEAAHQMCSNPLPPGIRKAGSVGIAAGPEVAIVDEGGNPLPSGTPGEVVIRGVNVCDGYLHLPEGQQGRLDGGWFRTGDLGQIDEDGYLFLSGRLKEIINRGGEKISPAEVDMMLLEHPAVAEAACFGIPHPTLGEDVVAAVRIHPGEVYDEAMLRSYLFDKLNHVKIPSRILLVESIPKSSIGKVQRSQLTKLLLPLLQTTHAIPLNKTEEFVAGAFQKSIPGCQIVGRNDNFFSLGGDSLQGIQAAHAIGNQYKIEMQASEIFRHPTPALLSGRIEVLRQEQLLASLEKRLASLPEDQLEAYLNKSMLNN